MSTTQSSWRLSRRAFLGAAVASAGAVTAAGAGLLRAADVLAAAPPKSVTRYPLYVPPTFDMGAFSTSSRFALTAAPGTVDLARGGGRPSNAWLYNGYMPGPTLRADRGDEAHITLSNGLAQPTITHWHGMVVSHENDGHPMHAIQPGQTYQYDFPINQRAALNWYHPHPHMLTGEQVAMGLAGAFIVNDPEEAALGLPMREVPLVLRDTTLDRAGDMLYKPRSGGFEGQIPVVNGTLDPYLDVDRAWYRFRILGGSNARIFRLAFDNGDRFTLIGNDGGLLSGAVTVPTIDVAPGERLDVLVDFRDLPAGSSVVLRDLRAGWNLLEFRVGSGADPTPAPTSYSTIIPLANPVRTREFSFDGMTKINGREYDMDRIDFSVPLHQTELWRFRTNGNAPHPVHVHGASFQVVKRTGGRGVVFPWETGWKDTVLLEDRETVEVLIRFDAFTGVYLIHCHKLEHEDMGMMSNFEVVGA